MLFVGVVGVVVGDPALCFAETMHYVFLPQLRMKKDWGKCPPEIATQTIASLEKYTQQMYETIASSGNPTLASGQQVTHPPHLHPICHSSGLGSLFARDREGCTGRIPDVSAKTWRRTFRQKNMPKRLRLKTFAETFRMICGAYPVYARSPSPSQRPAPTSIVSRSPFPLCLCSCSTSLSKMGT